MANSDSSNNILLPPRPVSVVGAALSFLVPGLGQIYQGRVAKGILFLVCLYGLFFTGMTMGGWKNVYLPDLAQGPAAKWDNNPWKLSPPFTFLANLYNRPHYAGQFWIGVAAWPAILQYNNISVPVLRDFERAPPDEDEMNKFLTNSDKMPDLGWVYTVIAGVLNILVIYDALAGPAFGTGSPSAVPASRLTQETAAV